MYLRTLYFATDPFRIIPHIWGQFSPVFYISVVQKLILSVEELRDQYKIGGFSAHPKPPSPQTNLQNQSSKDDFALVSLFLKDLPCTGLHTDKKKKTKFSSYIRKFRWDRVQSHIWGRASHLNFLIYEKNLIFCRQSYMTFQPIPSEFPYIWGEFDFFFFYQCRNHLAEFHYLCYTCCRSTAPCFWHWPLPASAGIGRIDPAGTPDTRAYINQWNNKPPPAPALESPF